MCPSSSPTPLYRRKLVGRLRDPLTRATFAGFEAMSAGERQQQLAAPLNKLRHLLGRPVRAHRARADRSRIWTSRDVLRASARSSSSRWPRPGLAAQPLA